MTPEIKNRIEQIRRGEVPEGYKKTRAGIIPVEWQEKDLSDVLKKQTKKNADNSVNNVLTNSATRGIIRQTEYFDKQIANDENKEGYYIVKPGYFVYNPRISVGAPCGPFNKYYGETTGIMSPLYTVYKYADDSQYYSEFLSYYFNSSKSFMYLYPSIYFKPFSRANFLHMNSATFTDVVFCISLIKSLTIWKH